ncbi:hypothetical protein BU16DRAFT_66733 [Lophium mytilinum]|uniref:Uncharacterized protein n=1 Tax=Lophium mytilinum TaxID=390894 RepID=A0A6A6QR06_9PEZI|nr:hypothetical protein BU16DRAFT_66733 [Lophium mytilinum]
MAEKVDKTAELGRDHENTTPGESDESSHEQDGAEKPSDQSHNKEEVEGDIKHNSTRGNVLFAFGPNRSYFIYTNPRWQYSGPGAVVKAVPDTILPPYAVSITPEGDLFLAYKDEHLSPAWTWINAPDQGKAFLPRR